MADREISKDSEPDIATDRSIAYDAWFHTEVEAVIREADDPNAVLIPHEEVKRQMAARRGEWERSIAKKEAAS